MFLCTGLVGGPHPDTTKLMAFSLRDIHAVILELDDDITDSLQASDSGAGSKGGRGGVLSKRLHCCIAPAGAGTDQLPTQACGAPLLTWGSSSHCSACVKNIWCP